MNHAAYLKGQKAFFRRYYQRLPDSSNLLMVDDRLEAVKPTLYLRSTADTHVSIKGVNDPWALHAEVLHKYSNFFRRALSENSEDTPIKNISLGSVDAKMMSFVASWMYYGWDRATSKTFGSKECLPAATMAKIFLLADHLDMPLLCYESRCRILQELARAVASARRHLAINHCVLKQVYPFQQVGKVLRDSGTVQGDQLGREIENFIQNVKGAHNWFGVTKAFLAVFPKEGKWML
ncbi:hypothetical protein Hte_000498 [Hypoxylon texense]